MFCTCLCLLGCIRWCSVPKLGLASPASAVNGSTPLFAESHRGAGLQTRPGQGSFHTNGSLCVQPKGSCSKGGLDHPPQWQPQEHPWVWSLVACGATVWQTDTLRLGKSTFKNCSTIFLCNGMFKSNIRTQFSIITPVYRAVITMSRQLGK